MASDIPWDRGGGRKPAHGGGLDCQVAWRGSWVIFTGPHADWRGRWTGFTGRLTGLGSAVMGRKTNMWPGHGPPCRLREWPFGTCRGLTGFEGIHGEGKMTVSHEAPENPTALLGSAGFLRLLRSPKRKCMAFVVGSLRPRPRRPAALRLENGLLHLGFISAALREGREARGEGFRAPLVPPATARCGRRRSLALPPLRNERRCQAIAIRLLEGERSPSSKARMIAPSIPRNDGH